MSALEIVVIIFAIFVFVAVTTSIIMAKIRGKSTCDCGGDCSHCRGCSNKPRTEKSTKHNIVE